MAFGKRTAGSAPPPYTPPAELDAREAATPVRTRVTNPGAIDNKFIGLAVGVVTLISVLHDLRNKQKLTKQTKE